MNYPDAYDSINETREANDQAIAKLYDAVVDGFTFDPAYQSDADPLMHVFMNAYEYQQTGLSDVFHLIAYDLMLYANNIITEIENTRKVENFIAETFGALIAFDVAQA